jgi:flagellar basal body rod protein FlgF
MSKLADLTTEDFRAILNDFYAVPEKRNKMTQEEVIDMAKRLNAKINVPLIDETGEEKILVKIILKIDTFLYDHLPNEFYDLVRSPDKGIDEKEAKRLVRRLTRLANDKIDIPYLPEAAEHIAINFVIGLIVRAARKAFSFAQVRADSEKMVFTDSSDDVENLVA